MLLLGRAMQQRVNWFIQGFIFDIYILLLFFSTAYEEFYPFVIEKILQLQFFKIN